MHGNVSLSCVPVVSLLNIACHVVAAWLWRVCGCVNLRHAESRSAGHSSPLVTNTKHPCAAIIKVGCGCLKNTQLLCFTDAV